jgi:hypothetical protein
MRARWQYQRTLLTVAYLANCSQLGARMLLSKRDPEIMV